MARLLARAGHETALWVRDPARAAEIARTRENEKYLPGVRLPIDRLDVTGDLAIAARADVVFLAVPSFAMAETIDLVAPLLPERPILISLAKGLDRETNRMLLLKHIRESGGEGAKMEELLQVLPALSRHQVGRLLQSLRSEGKVAQLGRTKGGRWIASPGAQSAQ